MRSPETSTVVPRRFSHEDSLIPQKFTSDRMPMNPTMRTGIGRTPTRAEAYSEKARDWVAIEVSPEAITARPTT
jgi:hypothetical protein